MIEGLNNLLEESGQPGLDELRGLVQEILGGDASRGRVLDQQRLPTSRPHAYRVRFVIDGWIRAVVVEWMKPATAQRNQLVINRWLPAIGLGDNGPTLLGVAAEPNGQGTWHVYGDFGVRALDPSQPDLQGMRAAVGLIAQVHTRFAGHLLLPECRLLGRDLGINFYASTVRDALRALELLQPPAIELSSEHSALRDRLLARVHQLKDEQPLREQAVAAFGGPETLLQGDLRPGNLFVLPAIDGVEARLVGWDQAGVGPIIYDLSTFLLCFPIHQRMWILDLYRDAVRMVGWSLPSPPVSNLLFETAEFARFANCIIWPAIALIHDRIDGGFAELANVNHWFESWKPILPER